MDVNMKYKIVIFDMDGTTLNTLDDLTLCLNHILEKHGMPKREKREVGNFLGNGIRRLVELGVPTGTPAEDTEAVFSEFAEYYPQHCKEHTRPYDNIIELINKLKKAGVCCTLVSNKIDCAVKDLCEEHFKGLFDIAVGEKEGVRKKPYPDSVNNILDELGFTADEAVYVGDTEVDYQTAANSKMDFIAVDWGFRERETLVKLKPKYLVSSPDEIYNIVIQ